MVENRMREFVSGLLEGESESMPNSWADVKDPDKWLRDNGFRADGGSVEDEAETARKQQIAKDTLLGIAGIMEGGRTDEND
jgi:hypothetical protein